MSRYRDPQLQGVENYSYLFNLRQILIFKHKFLPYYQLFYRLIKQVKTTEVVISRIRAKTQRDYLVFYKEAGEALLNSIIAKHVKWILEIKARVGQLI